MNSHGSLATQLMQNLIQGLGKEAERAESAHDPILWMEKEFRIPETKDHHLKLMDYQKDILREALTKDSEGNYKYSIIIWSDIKKSIKSTIAAAVNLWGTEFFEWGERYVIANDLKQADSRVNQYIRRAIALNPRLKEKYKINGYRITSPNGSFIEAIPIDPSGEAGSNADMITFSELWGANEAAKQTMWAEMTLSPTKFGKSFRWVESYAGKTKESQLLFSLYDTGVRHGRLLWPDRLYPVTGADPMPLELYVNEEARMLCLWNTVPRCPWQTKEYYQSEASVLTPNQFARMHRNQWTSDEEGFVPIEWWRACKREAEAWPKVDRKRQPMVIAMDAGVSGANFGITMGYRHPAISDEIVVDFEQRWAPPVGGKIDFQGSEERPGPEMVIEKLVKENNVVEIAYDEFQLHDMATRLNKKGIAWFRSFPQGSDRLVADSDLRTIIREKRIWHRGEKDLEEHMENANAKTDDQDRRVRIVPRDEKSYVDLTVCLSMMSHELMRLNL